MKKYITTLFFSLIFISLYAQFHLNGSAFQLSDSCFQLTDTEDFKVGSIWNGTKINLNESFQVIMDLNLGCKDGNGADGIVFGFQPVSTSIGQAGEGIGFQNISPSLGIEFDTWQNGKLNDPAFDHISINRNGNMNHAASLAGPVQANATTANVEDCEFHEMRVNWDAEIFLLEVYFDCQLRLTYTGDIVNEIFGGDPFVFWGFTSATGGANNIHQVCFSYVTFLDGFEDVVICPGGQFQLHVSGGTSYKWTPSTGLSNSNIPNPIAAPTETTTYAVEVLDDCNNPFVDTITVFVDGDTVFFELGADTTLCEGEPLVLDATTESIHSVDYQWSNGATTPTQSANLSGLYAVTVTIDDYCMAEDRIKLNRIFSPKLNLGQDTFLCLGQSLELDAFFSNQVSYLWQDGSSNSSFIVQEPGGIFSATLTNECGTVKDQITVEYSDCSQVYFPNVFSPNGDGFNDAFFPLDGGDVQQVNFLRIFDRWGDLVFEAENFPPNSFDLGWNGKVGAALAASGVYVWLAEVVFRDGLVVLKRGEVLLLR